MKRDGKWWDQTWLNPLRAVKQFMAWATKCYAILHRIPESPIRGPGLNMMCPKITASAVAALLARIGITLKDTLAPLSVVTTCSSNPVLGSYPTFPIWRFWSAPCSCAFKMCRQSAALIFGHNSSLCPFVLLVSFSKVLSGFLRHDNRLAHFDAATLRTDRTQGVPATSVCDVFGSPFPLVTLLASFEPGPQLSQVIGRRQAKLSGTSLMRPYCAENEFHCHAAILQDRYSRVNNGKETNE